MSQATIQAVSGDAPTIGRSVDVRTHYAHVRYAAAETPGVIWYDPRDGHEYLATGTETSLEELDENDRVVTSVRLHAKNGRCQEADPNDEWVVRRTFAEIEHFQPLRVDAEPEPHVVTAETTEVYDDVYEARKAAADLVEDYSEAPYRNAVTQRLDELAAASAEAGE